MASQEQAVVTAINESYTEKYGFHEKDTYIFKTRKGIDHEVVDQICDLKGEPEWMRRFRHRSLDIFLRKPLPEWGGDVGQIDFDDIYYYIKPPDEGARSWDDVSEEVKNTFDRLGIPEAEQRFLSGVGAQYDSEVVYHNLQKDLESKGVIFLGMDDGLREHEALVREYFSTLIPPTDNKFAALNSAVWSGGSFI